MNSVWIFAIYALVNVGLCDATSYYRDVPTTECCLCDDASADPAKHCSTPRVCRNFFTHCSYCRTTKHYTNNAWRLKRECGDFSTCQADYSATLFEPSCRADASQPTNGATCYFCCHNTDRFKPRYCIDGDPETVYTKFNVTTSTSPPTTTTPRPTTTRPTTTQPPTTTTQTTTPRPTTTTAQQTTTTTQPPTTTTTQPPTTTTQPPTTTTLPPSTTSQSSKGQYCMVGDGKFTPQQCSDHLPMCMNTVVVTQNFTIIKKGCESNLLCDHDWEQDTKKRPECLKRNVSALQPSGPGLVCHYCCKSAPSTGTSGNSSACNEDVIPADVQTYIEQHVARDGGWSSWSPWQGCSPTCTGIQFRTRTCDNPFPNSLGKPCPGQGFEQLACGPSNCIVVRDGGWSSWSPWQGCSPTCTGIQFRTRQCDNPFPNSLGKPCQGQGFEQLDCGPSNCKVTGTGNPTLVG